MKTLGFGLKSLLKDPRWAEKHNINPQNQTAGSVVGDNKTKGTEESVFKRAKSGDVGNSANVNNIFAQNQNKVNGVNAEKDIFSQSKVGGANNNQNIFQMMNKFDEEHKAMAGTQGIQAPSQMDQMNQLGGDEIQKRLGKRLNMLM